MRPEAEAAAFLWDALTFARNVTVAVGTNSLETYLEGGPITWATERQIELVGEALNNLRKAAPELAERVPDVHKIIATRNILVHGYTEVNSTIVWQAATQAIPGLIPTLEALLAEVAQSD
ncbi:MAG: HepT-like ribonuclease domain-containing protein [Propionicimonas sp.]